MAILGAEDSISRSPRAKNTPSSQQKHNNQNNKVAMSKPTVNKSGGKIDAIQSELDATTNVLRENMYVSSQ
jgi:hypothetical protein